MFNFLKNFFKNTRKPSHTERSFSKIYNKVPNLSEIKVVLKDLLNIFLFHTHNLD